jgi:hypothetical protein
MASAARHPVRSRSEATRLKYALRSRRDEFGRNRQMVTGGVARSDVVHLPAIARARRRPQARAARREARLSDGSIAAPVGRRGHRDTISRASACGRLCAVSVRRRLTPEPERELPRDPVKWTRERSTSSYGRRSGASCARSSRTARRRCSRATASARASPPPTRRRGGSRPTRPARRSSSRRRPRAIKSARFYGARFASCTHAAACPARSRRRRTRRGRSATRGRLRAQARRLRRREHGPHDVSGHTRPLSARHSRRGVRHPRVAMGRHADARDERGQPHPRDRQPRRSDDRVRPTSARPAPTTTSSRSAPSTRPTSPTSKCPSSFARCSWGRPTSPTPSAYGASTRRSTSRRCSASSPTWPTTSSSRRASSAKRTNATSRARRIARPRALRHGRRRHRRRRERDLPQPGRHDPPRRVLERRGHRQGPAQSPQAFSTPTSPRPCRSTFPAWAGRSTTRSRTRAIGSRPSTAARLPDDERFVNRNAEAWWARSAKTSEAGLIDLDPDDEVSAAQLQSAQVEARRPRSADASASRRRTRCREARGAIKSPDRADAAILITGQRRHRGRGRMAARPALRSYPMLASRPARERRRRTALPAPLPGWSAARGRGRDRGSARGRRGRLGADRENGAMKSLCWLAHAEVDRRKGARLREIR